MSDTLPAARKPLGRKNYGSIPHLPTSRLGPNDYRIGDGQAKILTEKTRDRHDLVIVQEKLDGSNVGVARLNDQLVTLTRAGLRASASNYRQHKQFDYWVNTYAADEFGFLQEGERVVGEWLYQAHGTLYAAGKEYTPFVVFDIFDKDNQRLLYCDLLERLTESELCTAPLLHSGPALPVAAADELLGEYGHYGAYKDPAEGVIYRVERKGKVDFLAKWVREKHVPGKYLPELNSQYREPVLNYAFTLQKWVDNRPYLGA